MLRETYSQERRQYHKELHDEPENEHPQTGFKFQQRTLHLLPHVL